MAGVRILRVVICNKARLRAQNAVKWAVQMGRLPNLKEKFVRCADCDARAIEYDHRRYSEPLNVDPVCRAHNMKRGFALDQTFRDAITGEPRTEQDYRAERCKTIKLGADRILSAISGRPDYLKEQGERADWRNMRMRGRSQARWERCRDYLNSEHEYALVCGRTDTGKRKAMTGLEARRANVASEKQFITQIQSDKAKRLYRWVMTKNLQRIAA